MTISEQPPIPTAHATHDASAASSLPGQPSPRMPLQLFADLTRLIARNASLLVCKYYRLSSRSSRSNASADHDAVPTAL